MEQANGASTTSNTKIGCAKRRGYFITFWNKEYPNTLPSNCSYLCTCDDATKDGKYHGHAFIYFKNTVGMKSVKKLFGNDCHIEQPRKNSECIAYVLDTSKRKSNQHEFGKRPMDNGIKQTVNELANVKEPSELDWRMYNTWKKIHDEQANDIDVDEWHKDVKVYYIQGPSGCGKTERAKQIVRDNKSTYGTSINIVKYENGFWSGIGKSKIAIYDDFRSSHMKASEFINFIDYNTHIMNIKNGSHKNEYNLIIITSVEKLDDIYRNMVGEPRLQWQRRCEVINMYDDNDVDVDSWL